jgi:hypothetical protein
MKNNFIRIIYFLITALVIIAPAIYCRYPLVFNDTGTYLDSSFSICPPGDRPIGYGLFIGFIRIVTMQVSMWYVVLLQGVIGSYFIYKVLQALFPTLSIKRVFSLHFSVVVFLAIFSSIGWFTSQIMPDIFTSFLILGIFLIMQPNVSAWNMVLYSALVFLFNISHFSNLFIYLGTLLAMFFYVIIKCRKTIPKMFYKRMAHLFAIWVIAIQFLMLFNNYRGHYGYVLNPSSNVFLTGKFCETGILKEYLDDNCSKINTTLCQYKDSLPSDEDAFVWHSNLPFSKLSWKERSNAYKPIVNGILTSPKYCSLFVWQCIKGSIVQFFQVDIGSGLGPYNSDTYIYTIVKKALNTGEFNDYVNDEQNTSTLDFTLFNKFNYLILSLSVIILFLSIFHNLIDKNLRKFINIVIVGVVANAIVTGSLSLPDSRYQARITWLIVFAAFCCLAEIMRKGRNNKLLRP